MRSSADTYLCRSTPGDDREFLEDLNGSAGQTSTGVRVTHRTALKYNPVWSAINRISGDIAKLPFNMVDVATAEPARNHPTQKAIRYRPNGLVSSFRFWRTYMFHALLWNRAYAYVERDSMGRCVGLYNLPPERVYPARNPQTGQPDIFQVFFEDDTLQLVPAAYILDVVGLQHDLWNELDTTELAGENWATGMAANKFLNLFFSQGAMASGILEVPYETKPESAVNLANGLDEQLKGLSTAFGVIPLRDGAKYHQLTIRPVDAQMVELLNQGVDDVARWFCIPKSKLGAKDAGGYGSREQDAADYLDGTLSPWLSNISSSCRLKLLTTSAQQSNKYDFVHDVDQLLMTDRKTQMETATLGITSGILNANEARRLLGRAPRDDEFGDEYFYSNNMQPVSLVGQEPEPEPEPTEVPADEEPTDEEPTEDDAAADAERMFRHEVERVLGAIQVRVKWQQSRRLDRFDAWYAENRGSLEMDAHNELRVAARMLSHFRKCTPESLGVAGVQEIWDRLEL